MKSSVLNSSPQLLSTETEKPPMIPGVPFFGQFFAMVNDIFPYLLKQEREVGPIFRIRVFKQEWVCMAGPEANAWVVHDGRNHLRNADQYEGFNRILGSDSFLISLDGPKHAHLRRIEKPAMSRQALIRKMAEAVQLTEDHISQWKDGERIDIVRQLKSLIVAHLSITLTGRDASGLLADIQIVLNHLVAVTQLKIWPGFLLKMPYFKRARKRVYDDIIALINERRNRPSAEGEEDLIDHMLAAQTLEGEPLPEDTIVAATMGAYMAGLDTSAIMASFALYGILKHPGVYERVIGEIDRVFDAGPFDWEALQTMPAFRGAIMESARLYPIVGLLPRDVVKDFEFGGYQVRKGTEVFLAATATHFNSTFYKDPERFDIDRFSPPRNEHKAAGAYAPFGIGAHRCLGADMGELQSMIVVATMLRYLKLEIYPRNYDLKIVTKPLRRPDPKFRIQVVGRRFPEEGR